MGSIERSPLAKRVGRLAQVEGSRCQGCASHFALWGLLAYEVEIFLTPFMLCIWLRFQL